MSIIIMIVLHHVWNERTESVNRCQPVNQSPHQAKETPRLVLNTAYYGLPESTVLYFTSSLPPPSREHQACCRLASSQDVRWPRSFGLS